MSFSLLSCICLFLGLDRFVSREEEELYALYPFRAFVEVGDDLTGPKASKSSLQRLKKGRNIRWRFGHCDSSLAIRCRWIPNAIGRYEALQILCQGWSIAPKIAP